MLITEILARFVRIDGDSIDDSTKKDEGRRC
jgi:hypothetical protein